MAYTVADGVYRFQSLSPAGGDDYLSLKTSGHVQGDSFDPSSENQKWKVTKRSDGFYDIANDGNGALWAVASPSGGETAYTISVKGDIKMMWNLDLSGSKLIIKGTGQFAGKVVDFSEGNRLVLWEATGLPNQTWILESVGGTAPKVKPTWVQVQGANIPEKAVQGGWDSQGQVLYLARVLEEVEQDDHKKHYFCGYAAPHVPGICHIGDKTYDTYEVLVADHGTYQWVPCASEQMLPSGIWSERHILARPMILATLFGTDYRYIARACRKGQVAVGSASPLAKELWATIDGRQNIIQLSYDPDSDRQVYAEVLCYVD